MAKAKKKTPKKVWHISRFRDRYELAENIRYDRKSPLLYTKDFVGSGSDDESCAYFRQLMALRSKASWLELRGAFAELKNIAGNMSKAFRGYLLNSDYEPATVKEIGRWLGTNEDKAEEILRELSDVGLIEEIDAPKFEVDAEGDNKTKKKKKKSPSKKKKVKKKATSKKAASQKKPVRARGRTENSGGAQNSLKKKTKTKTKAKAKANVKNNTNNGNGNDKSKEEINNGNNKLVHKAIAQKEGEHEAVTTSTPTTTPPLEPTKSDEEGTVIQFPVPSGSANHKPEVRYDQDAKIFGGEIYQALNLPWMPTSVRGRRELGCFASCWMRAKATGLPQHVLNELWDRSIREAKSIGKKTKRGKPAAIWCSVFNKILDKRCSENQCKAM